MSGVLASPSNYRPICSIPKLYKNLESAPLQSDREPPSRSHRLQKGSQHSGAQQHVDGLEGTRLRGTIQTVTHKALRPATSNSSHWRQKQTLQLRAGNQAGRLAQHAFVQFTPTIHHETTDRKVEEMQPRSRTCRTRLQHEPLQPQTCR